MNQTFDDLNGIMILLQRKMMKEFLDHMDELNQHIKNLDAEVDEHKSAAYVEIL